MAAAASASGVGKFFDIAKNIAGGIGKFYSENSDQINEGLRAYGAYRAMSRNPDKPMSQKDMMLMAYLNGQGGKGPVGAESFFPRGSKVDVDQIDETHPDDKNGTFRFKISGFSSSPFIRLKK